MFFKKKPKEITVNNPITGEIISLDKVEDPAFAEGMLGPGIGIKPSNGEVLSPFDGEVDTIFPTKHAIGLRSKDGAEVLIHIGLDTVNLEGKYFESFVEKGEKIKTGQKLVSFDIEEIEKAGYSVVTPVIVSNFNDFGDIDMPKLGNMTSGEILMTIHKK